ncbi:MAG: NADH-quinone oxidoreductase subunit A [Chloroflexi bacterium]|nr:NADH-quinone oxidoreductase subunit A [Chloroflexota bacterium]
MQADWIFIGIFLLIGIIFPTVPIVAAWFLSPKKPNAKKYETYECGIETVGETWVQFKMQYYIFALVFVIFDVETVFLFPWAVAFDVMPFFMVFEGVIFIALLAGGLVYAWRKGALEWV